MKKKTKKTANAKKTKVKKDKETKKSWTTEDIKKYCEEAGYRIVLDKGQAPAPAQDAKGLWDQGTVFIPEGSSKGVKL